MRYGVCERSTSVDSRPMPQGPPSMTAAICPSKYASTSSAVLGLGAPEGLADGAASGSCAASMSASVAGWSGQRRPTVSPPARTISGTQSCARSTIVSGPGQKASASVYAAGGTSAQ